MSQTAAVAPSTAPSTNGVVASSSSSTSAAAKPAIQPTEVGWLFVPQYYTFLNQNPDRLHCFYTKKSTLIHGVEQEDEKPCFGQQEIHNKVVSLGFEDCKVYVSNVDSQSSAQGGIVIQVLGEMSNKSGPWRKFAQTFFLAEQPNGYFVLNDIFRYLKDEEETEEQAEEIDDDLRKDEADARAENRDVTGAKVDISAITQPGATPHVQPVITDGSRSQQVAAIGAAPTDSSVTDAVVEEAPAAATAAATPAATQPEGPSETAPAEESSTAAPAAASDDAASAVESAKQETAPAAAAAVAPATAPAPAAAAKPAEPPKPKTWANLAASNATTWGSAVRSDARGVSSSNSVSTPASSARPSTQQQQQPQSQQQRGSGGGGNSNPAASVFVKSVSSDHVTEAALRAALSQFGTLKDVQVNFSRNCAFADYTSVDAAKKAISASASRGGVSVGDKGWTVSVEEKRKPQQHGSGHQQQSGGGAGGRGGSRGGASGGGGRGGRGGKA